MRILVKKNGPYLVFGNIPLIKERIDYDDDKYLLVWKKIASFDSKETYSLCRCGKTKNAPFCDGSHEREKFGGECVADNTPFLKKAEKTDGPELLLYDEESLCAGAHFCTRAGGTWDLVEMSDDAESKEIAIQEVKDCPSGRLVLVDKKTGGEIEPDFQPSLSLIEDGITGTSGPIWVKGRIQIETEDGVRYELRNRVTLCRCGMSGNKPFCDARHVSYEFHDK